MGVRVVLFALAGIIQCSAAVLQACSTTLLPQMDSAGAWHAQAGQDRLVSSILNGRRNGYFVDLGSSCSGATCFVKQQSSRARLSLAWTLH